MATRLFWSRTSVGCRPWTNHYRSFSQASSTGRLCLKDLAPSTLKGQNVLMRVDFNVPVDKQTGAISDDTRIRESLPSIQYLKDAGARVVLASHMGRPKGKKDPSKSLQNVGVRLGELLQSPVKQADDCIGEQVKKQAGGLQNGEVLLLENVRFYKEEEGNDSKFCKALVDASQATVYVNDAFGTAHRAHATTAGVTAYINGPKAAGMLLEKELKFLGGVIDNPGDKFAAIIGGAKVSTKLPVLKTLLDKCSTMVLGGAMIFTFFKGRGYSVGSSLVEPDFIDAARELEELAKQKNVKLILPTDVVVADSFEENPKNVKTVPADQIPDGFYGMDIGAQSLEQIVMHLASCTPILWNGPMGVFEWDQFAKGTNRVAQVLAERTDAGAISIIGGGDSVAAINKAGLAEKMSHVSTGGGASLEMLEGITLPGVACLDVAKGN